MPNGIGSASSALVKRSRPDDDEDVGSRKQIAIASSDGGKSKGLVRSIKRTSGLQAPIVALSGAHKAEILDCKFSPDGQTIAAASSDKTISLWETYGENANLTLLQGHSKAVTAICWSPSAPRTSPRLFSASADGTLIVWNPSTGEKLRRLRGHKGIVNSLACTRGGKEILVSAGDDGLVLLWDPEDKYPLDRIEVGYPVTAVEFSDDGSQVFVAGVDNDIHVYDLSRKTILFSLRGHTDSPTSLQLSPSGSSLLSFSLDSTLRVWDVRPFAPEPPPGHIGSARLHRTLTGATSGFEQLLVKVAWSADGENVAVGGGDRTCTVWNVEKSKILYKLPGHKGTCTAAAFHPYEPIIVSSSTDQTLLLGEIDI
ncbi:putative U5 snRNP-specific 40 kd protein [Tilletiaria anomala UBC 951]|uniref:Putative U5 snRNP-specific 40 kd protein n=1 Tax=Tilletiaria anomala (strain ATCC 24038 / CBS 436.72 / UBC 951) TaxID=1037660 RepID=A0A066VHI0_TILAU|nr:putative U5 snRNP-specific 40 kd protein [Tilletiaria anomala UBC 951]KDN38209.1 putative U5 snRNP-specific 40 kd protein [Tilletiaria anomala UBC 951]